LARIVPDARPLYLDDLGTEVRQHLRRPRSRENPRQIENANAGQGLGLGHDA
jgi:hypothetical protein